MKSRGYDMTKKVIKGWTYNLARASDLVRWSNKDYPAFDSGDLFRTKEIAKVYLPKSELPLKRVTITIEVED
jgi:hypothetical protein